jgi:hypothetical protein
MAEIGRRAAGNKGLRSQAALFGRRYLKTKGRTTVLPFAALRPLRLTAIDAEFVLSENF